MWFSFREMLELFTKFEYNKLMMVKMQCHTTFYEGLMNMNIYYEKYLHFLLINYIAEGVPI